MEAYTGPTYAQQRNNKSIRRHSGLSVAFLERNGPCIARSVRLPKGLDFFAFKVLIAKSFHPEEHQ